MQKKNQSEVEWSYISEHHSSQTNRQQNISVFCWCGCKFHTIKNRVWRHIRRETSLRLDTQTKGCVLRTCSSVYLLKLFWVRRAHTRPFLSFSISLQGKFSNEGLICWAKPFSSATANCPCKILCYSITSFWNIGRIKRGPYFHIHKWLWKDSHVPLTSAAAFLPYFIR